MIKIPRAITVNTGEQEKIQPTIDNFLSNTADLVARTYEIRRNELRIDSGEIAYIQGQVTNDRITRLSYNGINVAVVLETRTELNRVHYDFFRNMTILRHVKRRA